MELPAEITKEGARKDLEDIQKVFDSLGVRLFLTYGALLGIYRNGDFIPYDDDIDLCIVDTIDYQTRKQIGFKLKDIGFTKQNILFKIYDHWEESVEGYNGGETSGIIVCQRNIRVTLFFFGEEECPIHGKEMVCVPLHHGTRLIHTPSHFFEKPDTIKYKGKKYLTPSPIKDYLTYMYGEDWKKPIKGKHAPQWVSQHPDLDPNLDPQI